LTASLLWFATNFTEAHLPKRARAAQTSVVRRAKNA
jgi:hypothetical protein